MSLNQIQIQIHELVRVKSTSLAFVESRVPAYTAVYQIDGMVTYKDEVTLLLVPYGALNDMAARLLAKEREGLLWPYRVRLEDVEIWSG